MPSSPPPNNSVSPPPSEELSSTTTSRSWNPAPLGSPRNMRNILDRILGEMNSSPSTSSTPQTLSSPLPPSRLENKEIIARDDQPIEVSSEDGKEDELRYGEEHFEYGDEASDGYEDEDKSMNSSDEESMEIEEDGEGNKGGNEDYDNEDGEKWGEAATLNPAFSNVYVHHHPAEINSEKKREKWSGQGDMIEEVLNTSYMTGRTASSHYTSGVWAGHELISKSEQIRRDNLRNQINEELTKKWEQHQGRLPQAAAEEDRYDSGAAPEWILVAEDLDSKQKESSLRADEDNVEKPNSRHVTSTIPTTPVPQSGKENLLHSESPTKRGRKASTPDELTDIAQDAFLGDLDPEEQAELEELEKYRDDDLAPLDGIVANDDENDSIVERGTPVKDAYKLYLHERSWSCGGEDEIEDAKIGEEEEEEEQNGVAPILSPAELSPHGISRKQPRNSILCEVVQYSDTDTEPEDPKSLQEVTQERSTPGEHAGIMFVLGLGLLITVFVQLAWSAISEHYDEGTDSKL